MARLAVIGAGLSGLVVARNLRHQHDVVVFDKSRGVGGRLATRYAGDYEFDHGAQYFTVRTPEFQAFIDPLIEQGVITNWPARFVELSRGRITATRDWKTDYPHYVGVQRMNVIGRTLAADLDVRLETPVHRMTRADSVWALEDPKGQKLGHFDAVVLAMPAEQTAALAPADSELHQVASIATMTACFTVMIGNKRPLGLDWQAALVRDADVSWVSVNSSKPGRGIAETLVVHSTNAFADDRLNDDREQVLAHLLSEASEVTGRDCHEADHIQIHRWRYANIKKRRGPAFWLDPTTGLAACGDWFIQGRVEAAFTSGQRLSEALLTAM